METAKTSAEIESTTLPTAAEGESLRAQAKRRQILEAARRLFTERGFEGTSMDEITAAAGVSKRTLYKYYASKEALLADVIYRISLGTEPARRVSLEQLHIGSAAELEAFLFRLACSITDHHFEPEYLALLRTIIAETPRFPQLTEQYFAAVIAPGFEFLAQVFDRARAAGIVRVSDNRVLIRLFMGSLLLSTYCFGLMAIGPPRKPNRDDLALQVQLFVAAIT